MKRKAKSTKKELTVQTLKLDRALHVRLATFGAKTGQSKQDIMYAALDAYLKKMNA